MVKVVRVVVYYVGVYIFKFIKQNSKSFKVSLMFRCKKNGNLLTEIPENPIEMLTNENYEPIFELIKNNTVRDKKIPKLKYTDLDISILEYIKNPKILKKFE